MFKYKVSIYMKSGNIIYERMNANDVKMIRQDWANKEIIIICWFIKGCPESNVIEKSEIEAIIIKKWYQKWG